MIDTRHVPASRIRKEYHILSLGAGVQSTTVYLLAMDGAFHLDAAVFADTGDEPKAVYAHLEWLQSLNGPRIIERSVAHLSVDLIAGVNSYGKPCATTVPLYTPMPDGSIGQTKRQCSKNYKVLVVEKAIRRDVLSLAPGRRIPRGTSVHQYFGISLDEAGRALRIRERVTLPHFPLIDRRWTRADCLRFLASRVPHQVPRSACVYCPYKSDAEWMDLRNSSPDDWGRAVEVDAALRLTRRKVGHDKDAKLFVHRTCVPLDQVQFRHERQFNMFTTECEGVCGV